MKLIIEIPNYVYEIYKEWHSNRMATVEQSLIANGIPYEERQKGKWIQDIQGDTICKNCGFECLYNEEGMYSLGRYCHHCGADMREADNEVN